MALLHRAASLNERNIVLASNSPRRRDLMQQLGLTDFVVTPSHFAEDLPKEAYSPESYAIATALGKANEVAERMTNEGESFDLVIGGDSVVVLGERTILEKPEDESDAMRMLGLLSGSTHRIVSGIALVRPGKPDVSFSESTEVRFVTLDDAAIAAYVATGEPMDKAGAYGIQGKAGSFVAAINGCYYNCVGFPLARVAQALNQPGFLE